VKRVTVVLVVLLITSTINRFAYAEEPGPEYNATQVMETMEPLFITPAMLNMQEYWLEQIYYEMNTLNFTVQQYRNQFNAMHLTSQAQLAETRNYHSTVTNHYQEILISDTDTSKIMTWILALMAFQAALLIVILFALPWRHN
jgi:hypothetical protein